MKEFTQARGSGRYRFGVRSVGFVLKIFICLSNTFIDYRLILESSIDIQIYAEVSYEIGKVKKI